MKYAISEKATLYTPDGYKRHYIDHTILNLEEWTRALYTHKQTTGKLGVVNYFTIDGECGYCCLGVLCKLKGVSLDSILKSYMPPASVNYVSQLPPKCYLIVEGISESFECLTEINDSGAVTFPEIAKIINILWTNEPNSTHPRQLL